MLNLCGKFNANALISEVLFIHYMILGQNDGVGSILWITLRILLYLLLYYTCTFSKCNNLTAIDVLIFAELFITRNTI